ncbi:endogenous retrovirus group K member 7 Pro protein-like [Cervus elaphus]|uniref:endogenous retrovirus group K member 7 Pro protein-like n=1 Tax=Cervus elaphus TaxID=9860 RepID=UPI001CC28386|nr:endogenous retrovirus group K member 7 Pro protein-like [Cervus elaphus]
MVGLLDTGADVSCVAGKDWPNSWPTQTTANELVGLGKAPSVVKSSQILSWQEEGQQGIFQPYVISSLPLTLWGRDILAQMGILLYSPDEKVSAQMLQIKYDPQKGLGKKQQGRLYPVELQVNNQRLGLGYPNS